MSNLVSNLLPLFTEFGLGGDSDIHLHEAEKNSAWDGKLVYSIDSESFPVYIGLTDGQLRTIIEMIDQPDQHRPEVVVVAETLLTQHLGIDLGQLIDAVDRRDRFTLVVDKVATHDDRLVGLVGQA